MQRPEEATDVYRYRRFLLHLKLGDLASAENVLNLISEDAGLQPLLLIGQGRYAEACQLWEDQLHEKPLETHSTILQNLAVTYTFCGQIEKSRKMMQTMANEATTDPTLWLNLCTVYELCSEQSTELKQRLVNSLADKGLENNWGSRLNSDFKL